MTSKLIVKNAKIWPSVLVLFLSGGFMWPIDWENHTYFQMEDPRRPQGKFPNQGGFNQGNQITGARVNQGKEPVKQCIQKLEVYESL